MTNYYKLDLLDPLLTVTNPGGDEGRLIVATPREYICSFHMKIVFENILYFTDIDKKYFAPSSVHCKVLNRLILHNKLM